MSGHLMQTKAGVAPEDQCCSRCHMSYQQFIDNGKPRCLGKPYTNAALWPDIRVKYHPGDIDWMYWATQIPRESGELWRRHPAAMVSRAARQALILRAPEY